jgi:CPA1 family monovalent cation:H+ antiporter
MLNIVAVLLVLTAAFSYANHRWLRWPTAIGVMAIALALSLVVLGLDRLGVSSPRGQEHLLLSSINFSTVLMQGMLSFLLFAGALHVDLNELRAYWWQVGGLALVGTAASTALIGFGTYWLLPLTGIALPLVYCLLFGALISPTDPIAVLSVLKTARVPRAVETTIAGESLINDGVGVVIFALLLEMLASGTPPTVSRGLTLFVQEAGGGVLLGLVIGYVVYHLLRSIDEPQVEVLLTIATVVGGYAVASRLHVSGPLAMVVIGLMLGNDGRAFAMSERTRTLLDMFWTTVDEILNGVLFVLIGLEVALIVFPDRWWLAGAVAIVLSLSARWLVAGMPIALLPSLFRLPKGSGKMLTWGGVRGGISVALALTLPAGPARDVVLMLTYCVVVFSILVQGLSIGQLARRLGLAAEESAASRH